MVPCNNIFPGSFFLFWRLSSGRIKNNNSEAGPLYSGSVSKKNRQVSIIIPAYNEETNIEKCVEAILAQDFKGELEVIVVNDGSTDKTAEVISRYPVTLIELKTNQGKSNALNVGIANATGEILVFSDSDSQMATDAVSLIVNCFEEQHDVDVVAGNVLIYEAQNNKSLLKYFQIIEYHIEKEVNRLLQSLNGTVFVCPSSLFAVRRHVTEKVMFSDKSVVENADFTIEVLKKSMKIVGEPDAIVYTPPHTSLGSGCEETIG